MADLCKSTLCRRSGFIVATGAVLVRRDLLGLPIDRRGNPRISELARLMLAYPDEAPYFRRVPPSLQRALAVPLSKLASAPR